MLYDDYEMPGILRDFLHYLETIKGKSRNTVNSYFYDLRIFFRFVKIHYELVQRQTPMEEIEISDIDIILIKKITLSDLYAFMAFASRDCNNKARSRSRKVASLKSFFNYLTNKAKLLQINPARELESPKIFKPLPRYLNIEESKQLLSCINGEYAERDFAILTLFLNCGMRLSELVGINISSIKDNILTVLGKGNKERNIYLNSACIMAIKEYMKVRSVEGVKDKDALFISERKKRIGRTTVQYTVKKYITEAGLDFKKYSTHKLRHTAATLMYKHGNADIRALQRILGHESIATTEIYTHLDEKQVKDAVESNPLANFNANSKDKEGNN